MKKLIFVYLIFFAACFVLPLFAIKAQETKQPQTEPYIPKKENQLLSLGKAEKERFKLQDITWPANPGEAEICLWKDDLYAAASITIDDNCAPDHEWWLEQCRKHGIKVTWFVITDGVDGKNKGFNGTWPQYQKLIDAGHAVESHTTNHKKTSATPEDFTRAAYGGSQYALNTNLKNYRNLTMAYPYGDGNPRIAGEYFIAARGTSGVINDANKINYLNTNKGDISQGFINVLLTGETGDHGPKWLNKRDKGNRRGWITPLYHYVPHGKTKAEKEQNRLKAEADIANLAGYKDRIWIDTFTAVAMYGQERDSATLKTVSADDSRIELSLTDLMRDDIFDYPLTIKVRLPDWKAIKATQNGQEITAKIIEHENAKFALIQAVPDKGNVVLTKI